MKKRIIPLLSVLLFLTAVLCGCKEQTVSSTIPESTVNGMTKGEWVGLLGDKFGYDSYESDVDYFADVGPDNEYYDEIQACAEWEILPETDSFKPYDTATWKYAIETSVRAIGIDKLNNSDAGMEVTEDNLVEFFTQRIAKVDSANLETGIMEEDAAQLIEYAYDYSAELRLNEKVEYTYNDGVKEVSADSVTLKGDGVTATINDGTSYEVGDIIYVAPSDKDAAYAIKVQSAEGSKITYVQADMEDVYEELKITGSFDGTVIDVEAAEGVNISRAARQPVGIMTCNAYTNNMPGQAGIIPNAVSGNASVMETGVKIENGNVVFDADLGDGARLNAVISDIKVNSDVDFGIFSGLKKADMTLSFKDNIKAEYKTGHKSKQVPLGTITVNLGSTPLTAKFSLVANLGFDGEVTITYTSKVIANVNYAKGKGLSKSVANNDATFDFHAQATVTVEPCIKAELCCLGRGLANVKVTTGIVAIATVDSDLLGNEPTCIDIYMYVPLRWAVNEDGCVMTDIKSDLKASGVVWDSENSPINMRYHWEDFVLVDACTRGSGKVETDVVDEEGVPYDEYEIFEFEDIVFGFFKVASQNLYLSKGETMVIGIISMPDGYSMSDLTYEVMDGSVCSAQGGNVTALNSGATTLKISTSDDKFSVFLTVIVEAEYNDTSGFQPL